MKKLLYLFTLSIFIFSCSTDLKEDLVVESLIPGSEGENLLEKEIIQFANFKNSISQKQEIKTEYLKKLLLPELKTKSTSTNEILVYVDTTNIIRFTHPDYTTYTFKVMTTIPGGFDNYILIETKTSLTEYIVKYNPSNGWTKSSGVPYTGSIEYLSENIYTKNTSCVLTIEPIYSNCSAGKNHPPDGSGGSCTVGYGSLIGYNIYKGSGCSSGGTGGSTVGSTGGDGTGSIGGGGTGGDGPYTGEISTDIDDDPIVLSAEMVFAYLGTSSVEYNYIMNSQNYLAQEAIGNFLISENHSTNSRYVAQKAILSIEAGQVNDFNAFLRYNRTFLNNSNNDLNNNTEGGFDQTSYSLFNPSQQAWPIINSVIPENKFIGWGYPNVPTNCMDYAKAQISEMGYQISNFFNSGNQTLQIYTEQNGVDHNKLSQGLSYLKYALENNIPVIVGIDLKSGTANPQTDNTTDHFVVIVGMGSDLNGNYFRFFDNASGVISKGANPANKLYYSSLTGKITGLSSTSYATAPGHHNYIITQIRKSKSL